MENLQPLYVCAYYRPNKDTVSALDSLELALTELQTELDKNPIAGLIVASDLNAPSVLSKWFFPVDKYKTKFVKYF